MSGPRKPLYLPQPTIPKQTPIGFTPSPAIFVVEPNTPATATAAIDRQAHAWARPSPPPCRTSPTPEGITGIALSYQWTRDDGMNVTDIDGATSATYVLTDADAEHEINVKITFEDDYHNLEGPFTATATEAVVPTEVLVRNIGQSPESAGEDFDNISPTTDCSSIHHRSQLGRLRADLNRRPLPYHRQHQHSRKPHNRNAERRTAAVYQAPLSARSPTRPASAPQGCIPSPLPRQTGAPYLRPTPPTGLPS